MAEETQPNPTAPLQVPVIYFDETTEYRKNYLTGRSELAADSSPAQVFFIKQELINWIAPLGLSNEGDVMMSARMVAGRNLIIKESEASALSQLTEVAEYRKNPATGKIDSTGAALYVQSLNVTHMYPAGVATDDENVYFVYFANGSSIVTDFGGIGDLGWNSAVQEYRKNPVTGQYYDNSTQVNVLRSGVVSISLAGTTASGDLVYVAYLSNGRRVFTNESGVTELRGI